MLFLLIFALFALSYLNGTFYACDLATSPALSREMGQYFATPLCIPSAVDMAAVSGALTHGSFDALQSAWAWSSERLKDLQRSSKKRGGQHHGVSRISQHGASKDFFYRLFSSFESILFINSMSALLSPTFGQVPTRPCLSLHSSVATKADLHWKMPA